MFGGELRSARAGLVVAAIAMLAAGCGEMIVDPLPPYDPATTVAHLDEAIGPVLESENLLAALAAASQALVDHSAAGAAALLDLRPRTDMTAAGGLLRRHRAALAAQVEIPAALVGQTLVWDVADDRYVVDPDGAPGPAEGVRVLYYTMDVETERPLEPLEPLGYLDITDQDVTGEERLGVVAVEVSGGQAVEILDCVVTLTGNFGASEGDLLMTATGILFARQTEVAFVLSQSFSWSEAANEETLAIRYEYDAGAAVDFHMAAVSTFEAPEWAELAVDMRVADAGEEVRLEALIQVNDAVSGRISIGGRTVIVIGGQDGAPTFGRADGTLLTGAELEALDEIWGYSVAILVWSEGFFEPSRVLLLAG